MTSKLIQTVKEKISSNENILPEEIFPWVAKHRVTKDKKEYDNQVRKIAIDAINQLDSDTLGQKAHAILSHRADNFKLGDVSDTKYLNFLKAKKMLHEILLFKSTRKKIQIHQIKDLPEQPGGLYRFFSPQHASFSDDLNRTDVKPLITLGIEYLREVMYKELENIFSYSRQRLDKEWGFMVPANIILPSHYAKYLSEHNLYCLHVEPGFAQGQDIKKLNEMGIINGSDLKPKHFSRQDHFNLYTGEKISVLPSGQTPDRDKNYFVTVGTIGDAHDNALLINNQYWRLASNFIVEHCTKSDKIKPSDILESKLKGKEAVIGGRFRADEGLSLDYIADLT